MLAATQRLRRSTDFAAAVRAGRRVGRGSLVVHLNSPEVPTVPDQVEDRSAEPASTGSTCLPARAGFVVSKAVGGAVLRNRVRRRLRHLVRERLPQLPAGSTLVVRALPAAATAGYERLAADLDAALTTARAPRPGRGRRDGTDRR